CNGANDTNTTVAPTTTTTVVTTAAPTSTPKVTTQKPSTAKPTTQKPTTPKPTTQKPTTVKPTTQKPTTVKPTTQKPTTVKPTTQKPTTVKPTSQKPTTVKPTTQNATTENPTTEPMTTMPQTTVAPTMPPQPATGNYSFQDPKTKVVCMYAEFGARFNVTYMMKNGKNNYSVTDLPTTGVTTTTSECGNTTQKLIMKFMGWTYQLWFVKSEDGNTYSVNTTALTYKIDGKKFPNANATGTNNTVLGYFSTGSNPTVTQSYMCNSEQDVSLGGGQVMLKTFNFRAQAFRTTNTTGFTGDTVDCAADDSTGNIVPIAVGAALAGLVIIVLIAYLIGRRKSRKGYESV
ncbi:unnamed protein product, partial [Owenia fusiformis]